tara:strand:+ start:224 stop:382 length:159 start_codon:yes stop_codon:yes gene_type:complete
MPETSAHINKKIYHTRSVTNQFEKSYDFDLSSEEWNKNKIKKQNCMYEYINS